MESKKNKTEEQIKQLYRNGIIDTENKVSVRREKIGGEERNRGRELRGTNFQLQNK